MSIGTRPGGGQSSCIILTVRADVRDVLKQELKALGVERLVLPSGNDDCVKQLIMAPEAVLVIDWEIGAAAVNQVLEAVRSHFKIETRPICLLIPEIDAKLIATGAEYGVSQMHAGPVSRDSLRECLTALLHEDEATRTVREALVKVATARSAGDWRVATPQLRELNDRVPNQERVIVELAENLIHENGWDEALALVAPLGDLEPPNIRALHLMGRCYLHKHDFEQAIGLLSRAKIINPHNVERLIDLGNACLLVDRLDEAQINFREALSLDADAKPATIGVGKCQLLAGEVNEALALLKAVSGPRELASIFNTAGVLSIRRGRFPQGLQLYQAAVTALGRDDRTQSRLLFNMGLGYLRWQKADKALACFVRSLELDPAYAKAERYRDLISRGGGPRPTDPAADADAGDERAFDEEEFSPAGSGKPARPLLDLDVALEPDPED